MNWQLAWRKSGRMTTEEPIASDKAFMLFDEVMKDGFGYGIHAPKWNWLRDKLAGWCLDKARCTDHTTADIWIERYKTIRGIK